MGSRASVYTWGISGPAFIRGYLIAAVAALAITLALRHWGGRLAGSRSRRPYCAK